MKRKILAMVPILALFGSLVMAGCAGETTVPKTEAEPKIIRIASIQPLSGPGGPWGIPITDGIRMGGEDVGVFTVDGQEYQWKVDAYDSEYKPDLASSSLQRAFYDLDTHYISMLGGSIVRACLPILDKENIMGFIQCFNGELTNPQRPNIFRYNHIPETHVAALYAPLVENRDIKTVALMTGNDESGIQILEIEKKMAESLGLEVVSETLTERTATDFFADLTKIIAQNPDMISTCNIAPGGQSMIVKQAGELGYEGLLYAGWLGDVELIWDVAGDYAEGVYYGTYCLVKEETEAQKELGKRYMETHTEGEWKGARGLVLAWHPMLPMVTEAMKKANSIDPTEVAPFLQDVEYDSVIGPMSFGGESLYGIKRQILFPCFLYRLTQGGAELLEVVPPPTDL